MITKTTFSKFNLFRLSQTPIYFLLFYLSVSILSAQSPYTLTNPNQLTAAFSATLLPGDIVILANGTYSGSATMKINGVGTAANPITYKAATPGGAIFTAGQTMDIGGEYCIIDGFKWKGGVGTSNFIEFRDNTNYGNYSTLKNCVVDGVTTTTGINPNSGVSTKHNWVVMYGTNNTVINCSFLNKITSGNMILGEYEFNAAAGRCIEVGHKILNNYFYNYSKIDAAATNSGDSEAIRIGESTYQNVQSNAIIQNNYFVQADGENEIITNKSKGNSYINNTFRRCRGSLVMRHGSHTVVNGNYFLGENVEGTGGIRIVDSYQTIRNNYIQDCTNVLDQAQWNNGITFLGGAVTGAVPCTGGTVTSGYQKVTNLNLSNNTFVNTEAPLFYNQAQGSTDPLGDVKDNLIYFAPGNANTTPVISGNATTDYANLGTALTYSGNEYKGTTLGVGVTNAGFAENTGITATASGEIFTITGGTAGVGADMGSYAPTTDAMVGYGIGACFVNNLGVTISGDCNVVIPETLIVGSLSQFSDVAGSQNVSVTANVSWSAATSDAWITTITPNSGTADATVSITVIANTGVERNGTVTFTQTSGTSGIVRTLNVSQAAPPPPDPRDGLTKINPNAADVEVFEACHQEIEPAHPGKFNDAFKSLDKNFTTLWAGSAALGDCLGDRVYIIYDLKGAFDLDLVDIATSSGKTYKLQILVSSSGTADVDFTNPFAAGDLLSNQDTSFKAFVLPAPAIGTKYVKIIGNGQVESTTSRYTSIHEIEFYGEPTPPLSVDENQVANSFLIYPNPTSNVLKITSKIATIKALVIFSIDGRKVFEKSINNPSSDMQQDVSFLANGTYLIQVTDKSNVSKSKMFIVSH